MEMSIEVELFICERCDLVIGERCGLFIGERCGLVIGERCGLFRQAWESWGMGVETASLIHIKIYH